MLLEFLIYYTQETVWACLGLLSLLIMNKRPGGLNGKMLEQKMNEHIELVELENELVNIEEIISGTNIHVKAGLKNHNALELKVLTEHIYLHDIHLRIENSDALKAHLNSISYQIATGSFHDGLPINPLKRFTSKILGSTLKHNFGPLKGVKAADNHAVYMTNIKGEMNCLIEYKPGVHNNTYSSFIIPPRFFILLASSFNTIRVDADLDATF